MSTLRRATPSDAVELFKLAKEFASSFDLEPEAFSGAFARLLSREDAYLVVAGGESRLEGYLLGVEHETFFANGKVAWLEEVMVREDKRRQGIGEALMEAFESWATERGAKLVALATRRAAPFYVSLGYEESATYFRKLL